MRDANRSPREVAVVIPVHDEECLLERCLRSVRTAADRLMDRLGTAARIVVVLDACSDRSEEIATAQQVETVRIARRCVGAARAEGVDHVIRTAATTRLWIACTDADSRVPADWLITHCRQATAGADLVLGRARLDPVDVSIPVYRRWAQHYGGGSATRHIHGANLGVSLEAYRQVGGFADLKEHEDVDLVSRLRQAGARVASAPDVLTSGRLYGRTPGGFAGYLRRLGAGSEGCGVDTSDGPGTEAVVDAPERRLRSSGHPDTRV
ncbi:hypothetical protein BHE97_11635 [Aeromicrobium sp. PE09-221]|uniref:glycosyltransferase n=1 Tax=Aeromicrobium sp. PE09-221 TaxID=1898043 RepID=UPI000B72E84E|nr:glycosyltransferase [Aeromicrobium sp. PE09-221]OUZ09141.1 hypothetical protein BHE97_11635 [Aeromicrobium sp. PE09-221]